MWWKDIISVLIFGIFSEITALNEALKNEVERLRIATGEIAAPSDAYSLGMQHIPYNQSAFFSHQPPSGPSDSQNIQIPQFHALQPSTSTPHHPMLASASVQALADTVQQDPLGRFQGLDISSSRGSHIVKSEAPSISASESSSSTFCSWVALLCDAPNPIYQIVHRLTPFLTSRKLTILQIFFVWNCFFNLSIQFEES